MINNFNEDNPPKIEIEGGTIITNIFDDRELLISTTTELDYDADGRIDKRSIKINAYDDEGLLISTVFQDSDDYSFFTITTTNAYNNAGQIVSTIVERIHEGASLNSDQRIITNNIYNDEGLLISIITESEESTPGSNNDNIFFRSHNVTNNTYNDEGLLISIVEETEKFFINSDDNFDIERSLTTTTNTYNEEGVWLSSFEEFDRELDGSVESTTTNVYNYVGEVEKDAILANPDLNQTFVLEGLQENGAVNSAFVASSQPKEGLIPYYRLRSLSNSGVYLFVSTEEYQAIFAEDSPQREQWLAEGLDLEGNDIAEFHLFPSGSNVGDSFELYRNVQNQ